jgi:hypothetical protein
MKKIQPHIQYAIDNERQCIELRKKQIAGYRMRIKLLKSGIKMGEVNKIVPPTKPNFRYSVKYYWKLRYEGEEWNERKEEM